MAELYTYREDWHLGDQAERLVGQYQLTLDAVVRAHPELQPCAVRCCHCGIRFLTHPRNARRENLGCPFGCRERHRRQRATERARKYYQTDSGRRKKKRLNGLRCKPSHDISGASLVESPALVEERSAEELSVLEPAGDSLHGERVHGTAAELELASEPSASPANVARPRESGPRKIVALQVADIVLNELTLANSRVLPYVRMVASLIEGRMINRQELIAALRKRMRQHSIGRRSRREYVLHYLNQHPPPRADL